MMMDARRFFASLLVASASVASLTSSSLCHAFKIRTNNQLLKIDCRAANASSGFRNAKLSPLSSDVINEELFESSEKSNVISSSRLRSDIIIVRGGDKSPVEGEGKISFNLNKADIVRYHGYLLVFLAAMSFLETVGGTKCYVHGK